MSRLSARLGLLLIGCLGAGVGPASAHPFDPFYEEKQGELAIIGDHLRQGQTAEALEQLDKAIAKFPKYGRLRTLKAQVLLYEGRTDAALEHVNQAIELDDADAEAYWLRGVARHYRKQLDDAIADFNRVLELEEHNQALRVRAVGSRGIALVDKGRLTEGLHDLDQAIEARPSAVAERQFRAIAQLALNKPEAARADIEHVLRVDSNNALSWRLLGQLRLATGTAAEALTALDRSITLNAKDPAAYRYRADAHRRLKNAAKARADAATACRLAGTSPCATP